VISPFVLNGLGLCLFRRLLSDEVAKMKSDRVKITPIRETQLECVKMGGLLKIIVKR
jgi:hypothetical protein